jgi:DMSO/TMAO reductase YedYZ molybdopterin-dependent catalytic subunit
MRPHPEPDLPARAAELALFRSRKRGLHIHDDAALNAETQVADLASALTPVEAFFVRNNGNLPQVDDPSAWTLAVEGEVERPRRWTVAELRAAFETVSVTAVLECAGNGRAAFRPATDGLPWGLGAVGCALWTGVRMADVLSAAGVKPSAVYTGHHAPDRLVKDPSRAALSRGLPIAKALAPETLLAFGMNGEPLPLLHGGPLRVVAPGFPGSAWQKWLERLVLRPVEHDGEKMQGTDYRLPERPLAPGEPVDPAGFKVIETMPVKSLITSPLDGFVLPRGEDLAISGFAWSGAGEVAAVQVSADGGASWHDAALEPARERFAWRAFAASLPVRAGEVVAMARATGADGSRQPLEPLWNPRGYCNNAVQRVRGLAQ